MTDGHAHDQGEAPVGLCADRDCPVGARRDERHQILDRDVRTSQRDRHPAGVLEHEAVGLQVAVALEDADPGFMAPLGHPHPGPFSSRRDGTALTPDPSP